MTKEELHKAFLEDLSALLKKYNADLSIDLNYWLNHDVSVVEFKGIYEGDNQRGYSQLELPKYLD